MCCIISEWRKYNSNFAIAIADDADSSIYISARTSQTSGATGRDGSSQEVVDAAAAGRGFYGLQSFGGDMTAKFVPPNPNNGVLHHPNNTVMFNNYLLSSGPQVWSLSSF